MRTVFNLSGGAVQCSDGGMWQCSPPPPTSSDEKSGRNSETSDGNQLIPLFHSRSPLLVRISPQFRNYHPNCVRQIDAIEAALHHPIGDRFLCHFAPTDVRDRHLPPLFRPQSMGVPHFRFLLYGRALQLFPIELSTVLDRLLCCHYFPTLAFDRNYGTSTPPPLRTNRTQLDDGIGRQVAIHHWLTAC